MSNVFKIKRAACFLICAVLAVSLSAPNAAAGFERFEQSERSERFEKHRNHYSVAGAAEREDAVRRVREDMSISPKIDELLDLYVEFSLYELTREQAILAMLRRSVLDYGLAPFLADSLLRLFDPYGGYFSSSDSGMFWMNAFMGYGFILNGRYLIDGHYYSTTIRRVFPHSPAAGAGFRPGDEFIRINGINVEGLGLAAVSNLLASIDAEISASFVVRRGGEEINMSIGKDVVFLPPVLFDLPFESTAVITIEDFMDFGIAIDFYMCMLYMIQEGFENLIIDLRGNRGGNLYVMAHILDMLVACKDVVLYSLKDRNGELDSLLSTGQGHAFDKIVVLVDGYTASASETFAQSLREIAGALIIGSRTHGKGLVQIHLELVNGSTAAITSAEILSSENYSHHGRGITPDIEITARSSTVIRDRLDQLNFVNSATIRHGADNRAALALNQRLSRIGYIHPDHVTSEVTDMTVTAVEIFQTFNNLPVGIDRIDHIFIEALNQTAAQAPFRYNPDGDTVMARAKEYIQNGR